MKNYCLREQTSPLTQLIQLSCQLLQYSPIRVCDSCLKWSIPILTLPFRNSWLGVKLASEGDIEYAAFAVEALPLLLHREQLRATATARTRGEVLWPILQRGPTDALLLPSWGSGADLWWWVLKKTVKNGIVVVIKINFGLMQNYQIGTSWQRSLLCDQLSIN